MLVLAALLLGPLAACAPEDGSGVQSQKMAAIQSRGKLICGVEGTLPGFSFVEPDGRYSGLDVDVCKAVAAALLGDASKVEYRNLNSSERFAALASGIKGLKDLAGKPICVESGTTTELNLADRMRELNVAYTPLKFQTSDQTYAAYLGARCVAVTSDRSQLAGKRSSFPNADAHALLPEVMSKEPLSPASVNSDPAWADALRWSIYALMQAEEWGLTQANVDAKLSEAKANPNLADLRRFLGVEGDFGKQLGLPSDFAFKAIKAVGNYGEMFDRNVGPASKLKLERGINRQWKEGGLTYAPPFR